MEYEIKYLREIADVFDSLHRTPTYTTSGFPMVRVGDIQPGFLKLDAAKLVSDADYKEYTRNVKPTVGDIVFSRVGAYSGVGSLVTTSTPFCLGQNTALIRAKSVPSRYLFVAMQSPFVKQQIENSAVGSTHKTISLHSIKNLKIPIRPRGTIEFIASILGALDDKIELNRRVNVTLEAIARAIFQSWFVDFDPVRAKAEGRETGLPTEIAALFPDGFVESELGEIPEGWSIDNVYQIADVLYGAPFTSALFNNQRLGRPLIST